jgi:hypothetical protein
MGARQRFGMTPTVFIHTNHKQLVGALVSSYSLKRNSRHPERFEVRVIHSDDHPFLKAREGQPFLREGRARIWRYDDLQSFTPLRFMPPQLMGYQGRAVVIDPDVFAVGDVTELLDRDMGGKAILCKARRTEKKFASSVMLLGEADALEMRAAVQRAVRDEAGLHGLDLAALRAGRDHRPLRGGVEQLR